MFPGHHELLFPASMFKLLPGVQGLSVLIYPLFVLINLINLLPKNMDPKMILDNFICRGFTKSWGHMESIQDGH